MNNPHKKKQAALPGLKEVKTTPGYHLGPSSRQNTSRIWTLEWGFGRHPRLQRTLLK